VIREQGPLREVVSHYKGRDLFESLSPETLRRLDLGRDDAPAPAEPTDETVRTP
jgi:ABC-2 type transport system ATP-binding protein